MSAASPSASATIEGLLTARHSVWHHYRNAIWFIRQLMSTEPRVATTWAICRVIIGACTPIEIWSAGKTIGAIASERQDSATTSPWLWASVFIGAMVLERVLEPIAGWAEQVVRQRGFSEYREHVLRNATEIDLGALEHQVFYDATRRIADELPETSTYMLGNAGEVLRTAPSIVGTAIILLTLDWRFLVAILLPSIPAILMSLKAGVDIWNVISDQTRDRRIAKYIATLMTGRAAAREIRLFGLKDFLLDRFSHHFLATRDELRKKQFLLSFRLQLVGILTNLLTIGVFIWLAFSVVQSFTPERTTILMTSFFAFNLWPLQQAAMALGKQGALATDVRALMNLPTPWRSVPPDRHTEPVTPVPGAIEARNLHYTYPGSNTPVIDGVSLTIPAGQRVAIVSENGAGKTTLIKLLLGLYEPTSGTVTLDGIELKDIPLPIRQQRLAAVFQHFTRLPLTWRENVTLDRPDHDRQLERVAVMSGSDQSLKKLPDGEETVLSPDLDGVDLSGGQWQRLAIARAGFRNAGVLALDEPTAALDPMAEVDIFQRFTRLANGKTTLLVSHRLGMCRLADRIIVLEHGRIIEDGAHDELLSQNGRYAHLWEIQARWYR